MQALHSVTLLSPASPTSPSQVHIPRYVYRVHRPSAQTRYSFGEGFRSKNQTTIVHQLAILDTVGVAHLRGQTNRSSPFISVYDDSAHAERMAHYFAQLYREETTIVRIDTSHLARGPLFRAANLLDWNTLSDMDKMLHQGEYLIMYKVPPQAITVETPIGRRWSQVGAIGSR